MYKLSNSLPQLSKYDMEHVIDKEMSGNLKEGMTTIGQWIICVVGVIGVLGGGGDNVISKICLISFSEVCQGQVSLLC